MANENLRKRIKPIRDQINSKLVSSDIKKLNIMRLGEILNLIDNLKVVLEEENAKIFSHAAEVLTEFLSKIIFEEIIYPTGMSYFINLYELLEDNIDELPMGPDSSEYFIKTVDRLKSMLIGIDFSKAPEVKIDEDGVIQRISEQAKQDVGTFLPDFISEGEDFLDAAESKILRLEKDPQNWEYIDAVFRIMHTLKGTSGFFGLDVIAKLAHNTEDILSQLKSNQIEFSQEVFEAILKSFDVFRQLINQLKDIVQGEEPKPVIVKQVYELQTRCLKNKTEQKIVASVSQSSKSNKLGEILINTGQVSQDQIEEALEQQQKKLGEILVEKGVISKDAVDDALKKQGITTGEPVSIDMIKIPANKLDELLEFIG
ncbi:MAG: Hpt domain-containing protein, partial [Desulfobacterales bacterium]|nr:Hpt domain-containing protein [Desulfobacterales bacterium]